VDLTDETLSTCLTNRSLQLIVLPTEQCNFRCSYCFEDFETGRMKPWVVAGLKRWIDDRADGLAALWMDWFGGEPLLAADIVEDLQRHVAGLARDHPELVTRSSMTTNGYLLDADRLSRMVGIGIRQYRIAVDGPPEMHDRTRRRADGRGTFERIWANLESARTLDEEFEIIVRLQLDRDNRDGVSRFLDLYRRSFGDDERFVLAATPLSCTRKAADESSYLDPVEGAVALEEVRRGAASRKLPIRQPPPSSPICHAARANSWLVRADGTLGKCTVALSHPANHVGRLFEDGHVEIDTPRTKDWMRGLWSGDELELACPMRGLTDPVVVT
jgi:uncharacterized protein